ncbi:MAG: PAS domain S-box protein [Polyangiaceae bacterium]|nr:PAS domain S-box protein [Polyangiaceae bacterium]
MGHHSEPIDAAEQAERSFAQTVLDLAGVIIVALDPSERVILINKMGCRVLGYAEDEILGRNWFDTAIPERLRPRVREVFTAVTSGSIELTSGIENYENPVLTKGGEERLIAWHNTLLRDANGEVVASLSSGEDITERRRAEEALRQSEENLAATLNSIGDGVIATDTEGRVEHMNPVAEKLTGYRRSEALGKPLSDIFQVVRERTREKLSDPVESALGTGTPGVLASRALLIARDGTERPISASRAPIRSATGELRGVVLVVRDRTEQRAAERALEDSESTLQSFFEGAPLSMGVAEIIDENDYVIVSCNAAAAAFTRMSREEIEGRRASEVLLPEHVTFWSALFRDAERKGKPLHVEIERGEGSKRRKLSVSIARIQTAHSSRPRFVFVSEDVTEREQLRMRVTIADRMASLGTLAAGVAHEMKNPLAYVLASLDFAARQANALEKLFAARPESDRPAELDLLARSLEQAREGAERVNAIAQDLRTFARTEEDQREPIDVMPVLESAIRIVWNEIRHRARLLRDFGPVPRVVANAARLGQVFVNLLVNAAHSIPEGNAAANEIRVCTKTSPEGHAVIEVKDTGSGISEEQLGRIFDPFFTTKPAGAGLGLGLSICHGIVSALGGEISAESRLGEGSLFRVTLPCAPAAASDRPPPEVTAPCEGPKRRAKLLLIDDEPAFRASLGHLIGAWHDVSTAASAREALDRLARGERFDLLLCDLMMPQMTGIDLYEELHRTAPDQAARMVFLSGGAFTARAQAFLTRVPNAYLEKPFKIEELNKLIESLVP